MEEGRLVLKGHRWAHRWHAEPYIHLANFASSSLMYGRVLPSGEMRCSLAASARSSQTNWRHSQ